MVSIPAPVLRCVEQLRQAGFEAYPVGGCVRDLVLGRTPEDWDVTTSARPQQVMALFDARPTGLRHGTVTVLLDGTALEVTTFRAEGAYSDGRHPDAVSFGVSLEDDLARRDFTINAMALAPDGAVIDPFGGLEHLREGRIVCVGEPERRFGEDALRMLRAVRFAAQLDFTIHPAAVSAIRSLAPKIHLVSRERIKAEVEKALLSPRPDRVGWMLDWGLLSAPRRPDLSPLLDLPAQPIPRWRGFCALTGFPIDSLPVERKLRMAILHPEREAVASLAVSGGELERLGFRGPEIGALQRKLAGHILRHPEDNVPERLLALARALGP